MQFSIAGGNTKPPKKKKGSSLMLLAFPNISHCIQLERKPRYTNFPIPFLHFKALMNAILCLCFGPLLIYSQCLSCVTNGGHSARIDHKILK